MELIRNQALISISISILLLANLQTYAGDSVNGTNHEKINKHFVLVHGAGHGAWCWYKLATLLRWGGHRVTTLDLAASGINPKQVLEIPSIADYLEPLTKFMESIPAKERVILVGHSFGGFGITKAMESFPQKIATAVFVTAVMPGRVLDAYTLQQEANQMARPPLDNRFTYDDGPSKPPTTLTFGPKFLSVRLYQLSPPEDLTLATTLVRPHRFYSKEDMNSEIKVSDEKYGKVSRVYIISDEDNILKKDFQQWMIKNNPVDLVMEIKGSDHMVMLSKPLKLFALLDQIARKYY